jgi:hypothetical protein
MVDENQISKEIVENKESDQDRIDFSKLRKSKNPLSKEFNSPFHKQLSFTERIKLRKKPRSPET